MDMFDYKKILFLLQKKKVKHDIYDRLAVQLEYGINLKESIHELLKRAKRNKNITVELVLNDVRSGIANGKTFADSIKKWVPDSDYTMIVSSEKAGKISEALNLIIKLDNMKSELLSEFLGGLISPIVLFLAVYGFLYYMGKYALGPILKMISTKVTGTATMLIALSNYVNSIWMFLLPIIIIVLISIIIYSFPRFTGNIRKELDKFFPYSIYRRYTGAVWLIGLSGLISSGINEVSALKEMAKYSNGYLKERLKSFYTGMQNGMNIGEAMQISNYNFPESDVVDDIAVFSNFPNFDEKLKLIAEQDIKKIRKYIKTISMAIQAVVNIALYMMIIFIVVGVLSLTQNISNSMHLH
ncbi:MAG: type II secretion system F family protein [bacterium]